MEKMFRIGEKRIILNMQESKIGYGYPRIFIEEEPGKTYINLDVTVSAPFRMKKEDFEDWAADAEVMTDVEEIKEACLEHRINYDMLKELLA